MAKLYNLARMTTATSGTGTITLGSAVQGFLTFAQSGVGDGETVAYSIRDSANSEVGTGVYTNSGTTLSRTPVKSTNSDAAISLSGSAQVMILPLKADIANLREDNTFTGNNTFNGAVTTGAQTTGALNGVTLDANAWTVNNPVVTSEGGTLTAATLNEYTKKIGRTVHLFGEIGSITVGSATNNLTFTPTYAPAHAGPIGSAWDRSTGGVLLACIVNNSGNIVVFVQQIQAHAYDFSITYESTS